jgi:uncharacterized membrane protein
MRDGVRFFSAGLLSVIAFIIIIALLILIVPVFILGIIGTAFTRLGFSWISAFAFVLLMVSGSFVNIPIYYLSRDIIRIPRNGTPSLIWDTRISLNVGGAVIPSVISIYLLYNAILIAGISLLITAGAGIITVTVMSFISTKRVMGTGVQVPLLVPGLTAVIISVLLFGGPGMTAATTAFVSGTMGTLAGGNIANIFRIRDLEIPEFSIGGAGTFGAIFLCCILPALIA